MKALRITLLILSSLIVIIIVDQYLFCPVYTFEKTTSFSGHSIYNPYASAIPEDWIKCNFHAHAHCWNGITNGKGTADDICNAYDKLHYGVRAISNYQYIDTTNQFSPNYISSYEHGYNVLKNHQLILGANTVCWKDYLLPQTLSNKQHILDNLNNTAPDGLVIINHPLLRNGYRFSDFKYLTHYSCMEVLNPSCNSSALWDECLSAGKPVFIIGNDDCHNVFDTNKVGRICTWINTTQPRQNNILQALKTGSGYAMRVGENLMEEERKGYNDSMPMLQKFVVKEDTVYAKFNLPANAIIVSGKHGALLHKISDTDAVSFRLDINEPYARITANYKNGTEVFLNPVFRYNKLPLYQAAAGIAATQTLWLRSAGMMILVLWFGFVLKRLFPKKIYHKLLPNISPGYGYISVINIKNSKVRARRPVWHFRGFFNNMDFERKSEVE